MPQLQQRVGHAPRGRERHGVTCDFLGPAKGRTCLAHDDIKQHKGRAGKQAKANGQRHPPVDHPKAVNHLAFHGRYVPCQSLKVARPYLIVTPTTSPTLSFQRCAQSPPARSADSGRTSLVRISRARAKSASLTSTRVMERASPAGHSPLPVRQAMSLTKAFCALSHAGSSKPLAISLVISACMSASRLFHLSMLIAVTTESQPPSGIGNRCVDTSHQPAL